MVQEYFSDREVPPVPPSLEEISAPAWGGITALINGLEAKEAFAIDYPERCDDGSGTCGTDTRLLQLAFESEIHGVGWPRAGKEVPTTLAALDVIEFCYKHLSAPRTERFHPFFQHFHYSFDRGAGRREFCDSVNLIFHRNQLAYEVDHEGRVRRLAPPILREALASAAFRSTDQQLNEYLEAARSKFLSPDPVTRREALEKLWDAWERLKTLLPGDKKSSVAALLNKAATEPKMRSRLDDEAVELTSIGNEFLIRHSETSKTPIDSPAHVDYLFHRLFSLIWLLMAST